MGLIFVHEVDLVCGHGVEMGFKLCRLIVGQLPVMRVAHVVFLIAKIGQLVADAVVLIPPLIERWLAEPMSCSWASPVFALPQCPVAVVGDHRIGVDAFIQGRLGQGGAAGISATAATPIRAGLRKFIRLLRLWTLAPLRQEKTRKAEECPRAVGGGAKRFSAHDPRPTSS